MCNSHAGPLHQKLQCHKNKKRLRNYNITTVDFLSYKIVKCWHFVSRETVISAYLKTVIFLQFQGSKLLASLDFAWHETVTCHSIIHFLKLSHFSTSLSVVIGEIYLFFETFIVVIVILEWGWARNTYLKVACMNRISVPQRKLQNSGVLYQPALVEIVIYFFSFHDIQYNMHAKCWKQNQPAFNNLFQTVGQNMTFCFVHTRCRPATQRLYMLCRYVAHLCGSSLFLTEW